jgi:hypothetical protein
MAPEVLISAVAMMISIAALGVSTIISTAQARSMRQANNLPVMIELLIKEYINDDFAGRERLVFESIRGTGSDLGFEGLAEPLRTAAYNVAWFYDATGNIVALRAVDERLFVGGINYRIRRAWSAMEAHIEAERRIRGMPFLDGFEHLAARAFASDPNYLQRKLKFQKVAADAKRIDARPDRVTPASNSGDQPAEDPPIS